jgi:hypothetical protein
MKTQMYRECLIYSPEGEFIGYGILKPAGNQFKSVNIWTDEEVDDLASQIERLNADVSIKASWPSVDDPGVRRLVDDPTWNPIETVEIREVDEDNSHYVFDEETGDIDKDATVLAYFPPRMAPVRPVEAVARTKKAQETIARLRGA